VYISFREKKAAGGRNGTGGSFNVAEYNMLIEDFNNNKHLEDYCHPQGTKPTGPTTFSMYKAVLRKIDEVEIAEEVQKKDWDHIWTQRGDKLYSLVKERAPLAKKQNCHEKVDNEFSSYTLVEHFNSIEATLWEDSRHATGQQSLCAMLRHRYCCLHLASGVLRSESLHRAELSDFRSHHVPKKSTDIHPMMLMINQLALGKTNHGRTLYGRATHHQSGAPLHWRSCFLFKLPVPIDG